MDRQIPHDERYDRADEFMDVVYALWEGTFAPGALVADDEAGVYLDPERVHGAGHEGRWFSVPGPGLTLPGPQGTPFLFQAGSSPRGLEFAARHAEALFFSGTTPENVRRLTDALTAHLERAGRPWDAIRTITSVTVVAAETDDAARARLDVEMQRRVPKRANLIHTPSSTPDIDVMRSRKIKRPPLRLTTRLVPVSDGFLNLWTKYLLLPQARASPVRGAC